jgi:hypothetical protein
MPKGLAIKPLMALSFCGCVASRGALENISKFLNADIGTSIILSYPWFTFATGRGAVIELAVQRSMISFLPFVKRQSRTGPFALFVIKNGYFGFAFELRSVCATGLWRRRRRFRANFYAGLSLVFSTWQCRTAKVSHIPALQRIFFLKFPLTCNYALEICRTSLTECLSASCRHKANMFFLLQ